MHKPPPPTAATAPASGAVVAVVQFAPLITMVAA
eukprot:CAMPEP_0168463992 /NCGR_PEP_ID=MMETSP0228-20121227/55345_1 /TAXON_ID=133427 /ORGANISM="Protoceratium reticulatum, Strain CCCM 535 (=CCMP 1889)" /LENGTH=33 /DNA_ID= /DNA_START= /DNA_END= /DNA_ORIENTATION=